MLTVFFAAWILQACSAAEKPDLASQQVVAVAAVSQSTQGLLQMFPSPTAGEGARVNLPAPGYPLGGKWSPDGRFYAFTMIKSADDTDIYRLDWLDKKVIQLTETPTCPEIGLSWAFDSGSIIFANFCKTEDQITSFYRMASDGSQLTRLGEIQFDAIWAIYAPDNSRVALVSSPRVSGSEVRLAGIDGSGLAQLTVNASTGYEGQSATILDWSPKSNYVVFATSPITIGQASANQIVVINAEATDRRVLVQPPAGLQCYFPRWSPDNSHVIFTCGSDLMSIRLDGSELMNLTNGLEGRFIEFPIWAEDGKSVVFLSGNSVGRRRLERVQISTRERIALGEVQASLFYSLEWQPISLASTTAMSSSGTTPSGEGLSVQNNQPEDLKWIIPWLIIGWLVVVVIIAAVFSYRALMRSAGRLPGLLDNLRTNERSRIERRASRRTRPGDQIGSTEGSLRSGIQPTANDAKPALQLDRSKMPDGSGTRSSSAELLEKGIREARTGDPDNAVDSLRAYLAEHSYDSTAWLWMGFAAGQRLDWRTAESCFRRAGKLGNPQYEEALAWLDEHRKLME